MPPIAIARRLAVALLACGAFSLIPSAAARAAVTVGSDLSEPAATPAQAKGCEPVLAPCTNMLAGVKRGNAYGATSATDGTVVAFDVKAGGPDTLTFRLLRQNAAIAAKVILVAGDGTGPTVTLPTAGTYQFPVSLPIRAGDAVGFDASSYTAYGACLTGASSYLFSPPLEDGRASIPPSGGSCELLLNAVVEPSAAVSFGRASVDRAGRVRLALRLPGPGDLTLGGSGIGRLSRRIPGAGRLFVRLRLRPATRRRLARGEVVALALSATFAPLGGTAASTSATVKVRP
jgi:hypothetical protein